MSLCVKLYQDSDILFQDPLWSSAQAKTLVVCPSPAEADRVRARIKQHHNVDVITVSKFVSSQLERLEEPPTISRKADLMLRLSVFWKKVFPEHGHERFTQCFTLLTELRGTSLDVETMQEILQEYHPDVAQGIEMLWRSLQLSGLHDEHSSYAVLSEAYRKSPSPLASDESARIIVYGFSHLSGVQLDMLKAMSLRHEVITPYRASLYEARYSSDWISWLTTEQEQLPPLKERAPKKYPLYLFAKNRLAETLKKLEFSRGDVLLGTTRPLLRDYLEIPLAHMFFKSPVDLLGESFGFLEQRVRALLQHGQLPLEALQGELEQERINFLRTKNFRALKAVNLCQEVLREWNGLASVNDIVTVFDWEIIRQSVRLKSPRVYQAPNLGQTQVRGRVLGFSEASDVAANEKVVVCLTSNHVSPKLSESEYSPKVSGLLSALGPKRRKELDFLKLREEFREVLARAEVSFCIEEGLIEHDLGWAEMLQSIEFDLGTLAPAPRRQRQDLLNGREFQSMTAPPTISPSRLQTYADCPRQYYFQYVEQLGQTATPTQDLSPSILGEIEHDIVAKFLERSLSWDEKLHKRVCQEVLQKTLSSQGITLEPTARASYTIEIENFSRHGINFVQTLLKHLPAPELVFEAPYQDGAFKGRVDLLVRTSMGVGILDFKRSSASIPSKTAHENFLKLQLWNYLQHVPAEQDILFWGYVCLKDPADSLFYSSWSELQGIFEQACRVHSKDSAELKQQLEEYGTYESALWEGLKNERDWHAKPRTNDVCTFCSVNALCSRGLIT